MRSSRLRTAFTLSGALLAMAANCEQCQQIGDPRRGNVDRVTDVVIVAAADGHSYAVSANPELQHLRVLDLTDGRFLTAPNRYFPLSVPVGAETRRLAVAVDVRTQSEDPTRVYAVDNADDVVQLVRVTDDDGAPAFDVVGTVGTGRGPGDVAALRIDDTTVIVAVTRADAGLVQLHRVVDDAVVESVGVPLPVSADPALVDVVPAPAAIVADPLGRAFIVADAALPQVVALEIDAATLSATTRSVDVGGPVQALAAGVVDVGDGLAPVVLASRADTAAVMAVRLFRPGFVEDRYALLGGTGLPAPGSTLYVPDARESAAEVTVCCNGLSDDQIAAGEATASFAAVTLVDGRLLYLHLAAATLDGIDLEGDRRLVRLIDDDPAPPGPPEGIDVNSDATLWVPVEGGEDRRPRVTFTTVDNLGTPPFVPVVASGASLLLAWEDELPPARRLRGVFSPGPRAFVAEVDVARRGARAGDLARLVPETVRTGCDAQVDARIVAVDTTTVTLAFEGDGTGLEPFITESDAASCLQGAGEVRLTVLVADAFVVTEGDRFRGRLAFVEDGAPPSADHQVELAGVRITVDVASAGKPLPLSRLAIPLDARVTTLGLDLPNSSVGTLSFVPTSIAGGTIVMPDPEDTSARIPARRMVMSTAGIGSSTFTSAGLPGLLTCDEAETTVTVVEIFN
jgi:hypothetical protein